MPPRYAYWTILAGGLPTAFRAAEREELLPTFKRIQDKHPDAQMKYFARGKLWESKDAANAQRTQPPSSDRRGAPPGSPERDRRGRDWRPGGEHRDPRQKFIDAKKDRNLDRRKDRFARKNRPAGDQPWRDRPAPPPRDAKAGPAPPKPEAKAGPPREKPHGDPLRRAEAPPGAERKRSGPPKAPWRDRPSGHASGRPPARENQWRDRPAPPKWDGKARPPRENQWRDRPAPPKWDAKARPPREKPHGDKLKTGSYPPGRPPGKPSGRPPGRPPSGRPPSSPGRPSGRPSGRPPGRPSNDRRRRS